MSLASEFCLIFAYLIGLGVYHTQKSATAELIHINKKHCKGSKISSHVLIKCSPYQKVFHSKVVHLDDICVVRYVQIFVVSEVFFRKCKFSM